MLPPDALAIVDLPGTLIGGASMSDSISLSVLGNDLFIFLAATVLVVPTCRALNITPVLGFLALGCAIGPNGVGLFADTEADLELGDFGILFLLFVEGLNLSPDRLQKLGSFFRLGVSQLLLSISAFFFATLLIGPQLLTASERVVPLDDAILRPILSSPVETFCIAAAGSLSSSAFVLPVLKQKGWEERADGTAALAVLLLQDLAVAPLLVVLPLVAGSGPQDPSALGVLVAKATFGFGAVLAAGSIVLRRIFALVASSRSTETFVAAALLVAVGMGAAADTLGLSSTTGAFAAGVLLAGSQYRAQIEADIKPFEGILLGVFFMTAGANLDPALCVREWPTLLTGILAFLGVKAGVLFLAGELALGLTRAESSRIALLLAGGGEFAFVVFKLAEDLGVLPGTLNKLLTASVIISMSLTPLLGELAEAVGARFEQQEDARVGDARSDELTAVAAGGGGSEVDAPIVATDAIVVCGYGEMGQRVCDVLAAPDFVAFDRNPARVAIGTANGVRVVYGDGASVSLLRAAGLRAPRAIVITYASPGRCLEATRRLHDAYPAVPIYVRSRVASEAEALLQAGASEVIVEAVEAAVRISALLQVDAPLRPSASESRLRSLDRSLLPPPGPPYTMDERSALADTAGISITEVDELYKVFVTLDTDDDGDATLEEVRDVLMRTSVAPIDDDALVEWLRGADADGDGGISFPEFVQVAAGAQSLPARKV